MNEILTVTEAAKKLGVQPKVVRFNMQKGIWNIGEVIPPSVTGKKQNTYRIYARQMCKKFGIPFQEGG